MTELMKMIAPKRLFAVSGIALNKEHGIVHVEERQLFAAIDEEDALAQANKFWTEDMGFSSYTGYAKLIDRVGGHKVVVLVSDEMEESK
jgi:hypothetical protein